MTIKRERMSKFKNIAKEYKAKYSKVRERRENWKTKKEELKVILENIVNICDIGLCVLENDSCFKNMDVVVLAFKAELTDVGYEREYTSLEGKAKKESVFGKILGAKLYFVQNLNGRICVASHGFVERMPLISGEEMPSLDLVGDYDIEDLDEETVIILVTEFLETSLESSYYVEVEYVGDAEEIIEKSMMNALNKIS